MIRKSSSEVSMMSEEIDISELSYLSRFMNYPSRNPELNTIWNQNITDIKDFKDHLIV